MTEPADADVRMRGFSHRVPVEEAQGWADQQAKTLGAERVPLAELAGRVLHGDVVSAVEVPGFDRAMMDGYAVRAEETLGATPYNHLQCQLVGQSLPGAPHGEPLRPGQAIRIMTGAPLPDGADAVLPAERTQESGEHVLLMGEVSPGKHVGRRGEDIRSGDQVLAAGRRLRPQDIGVLSSIGAAEAQVVRRPRVQIVITGDELLPAGSRPEGVRISDANGPMLDALVRRDGGAPTRVGPLADDPELLLEAMRADADVVLISGGSSVGQEDHAPVLLAQHGELAIHGVAMRPSSPAGMGRLGKVLVFLLPGNPVSCLCAYDFFAGRSIRQLGGREARWPYGERRGTLRRKLVSTVGRTDYARVRWIDGEVEPLAIAGASVLSSTTRADGFVVVPGDSEGFGAGAEVTMHLYDSALCQDS